MTYGIEFFDETSKLKFSSEFKTIRAIFSFSLSKGSSGSVTVSEFDSSKGFYCVNIQGVEADGINDSFNNSTKVFSWSNASGETVVSFFNVD